MESNLSSLLPLAKSGDKQSALTIVEGYMNLINFKVKQRCTNHIPHKDLAKRGIRGVYIAIDQYDSSSCDFSLLIQSCVDREIINYVNIRLMSENSVSTNLLQFQETAELLRRELERDPSIEEVANNMDISSSCAQSLFELTQSNNILTKIEYRRVIETIPEDISEILHSINLNEKEIILVAHLLKMMGGLSKSRKDLADYLDFDLKYLQERLRVAIERINQSPFRDKIINYSFSLVEEEKIKNMTSCNIDQLNELFSRLTQNDIDLLKRRCLDIFDCFMTEEEKTCFNRYVKSKIKKTAYVIKEEHNKPNKPDFLSERAIKGRVLELLAKAETKPVFKEFIKFFCIEETLAIMMYCGFIEERLYTLEEISTTLNIDKPTLTFLFKKQSLAFKSEEVLKEEAGMIKRLSSD